jgi:hypothetical protein
MSTLPSRSGAVRSVLLLVLICVAAASAPAARSAGYDDLLTLFKEWRDFQRPKLVQGVPDYSPAAMSAQQRELPRFQARLKAIDPGAWPVPRQVDWHLVRAETNGLDFDLRVRKPWATNPAFYVTVFPSQSDQPAREGPSAFGSIEIWTYAFPLTPDKAAEMAAGVRAIPGLLDQAKKNLTGKGKDLWTFGTKSIKDQSEDLARLAKRVAGSPGTLEADVAAAKTATDAFVSWLEAQAPSKTATSGVGIENYDWYLKNVQLVPYSWRDEVVLMERELTRARALLALEEQRNSSLPVQMPIASDEEHARRFDAAITEYMAFLRDRQILTVRDYMEPALRARMGRFRPGPFEFFTEVNYRDPEIMRTHDYHWFDLAQMVKNPHADPIRRGPLLYNVFVTRTEGHATGWEEMMMQAGMLDARPRSRELVYILLAQRAARALGDLRMHANQMSLEQAAAFASACTPRGWLRLDGTTVRGEQHLYLQQPAYGTSYVIGKIQIEELLADKKAQLGEAFTMKRFMDEFNAAGLIPVSMLRWEMTGVKPAGL